MEDSQAARIGQRVRAAREAVGKSQTDIADAMQVAGFSWAQDMVTRTERGIRTLGLLEADRLAELLDTTIDELLGYPLLTERQWAAIELEGMQAEISALVSRRIERLGQD